MLDHTIERSVLKLWNDAQVKESFEKEKKVVTFLKSRSSTIGSNEFVKLSLMKSQKSIQESFRRLSYHSIK